MLNVHQKLQECPPYFMYTSDKMSDVSKYFTYTLYAACWITLMPPSYALVILGDVFVFFVFFLVVCFTRYLVFHIAVLPHRPGVVYYHLLLRRETRIPGVAPFSFQIGIWDLFVHREQKSYTPTAFGKLWTTPGVRCMKHASS